MPPNHKNQNIDPALVYFDGSQTALKTRFSKIGLKPIQMSTSPFWGVFREVFGVRSYQNTLEPGLYFDFYGLGA